VELAIQVRYALGLECHDVVDRPPALRCSLLAGNGKDPP
jgi:hypothetical protein